MFVRTVLGDVDPRLLGPTSGHDHLFVFPAAYNELPERVLITDFDKTREEVLRFRGRGGGAVVDLQPFGGGRNPLLLQRLSGETEVRIVAATGLHKSAFYKKTFWSFGAGASELEDLFVSEIEQGMYEFDRHDPFARRGTVKAGAIKIATENGALNAYEAKVFDAAAAAHRRTGAPIFTHTELSQGGLEQAERLIGSGVGPDRIVIGHMDRVIRIERNLALAELGVFQAFDTIARYKYHDDEDEAEMIRALVKAGFGDRILLGMDSTPERFRAYGGGLGLDYLLTTFVDLLVKRGVGEDSVGMMLVDNPRAALRFSRGGAAR